MKRFQILEHITDLKIKVFGENKEELFKNAMTGMFEAARYEAEAESKKSEIKIKVKSFDFNSLLIDFLSEILYFCETRNQVYQNVIFKKFSNTELEAILIGKKLKKIGTQIKGATYHSLEIIQKGKNNWEAIILFDI